MSPAERDNNRDLVRRRLGRNIGRRRKELGISRADCATRAGVSVSEVAALERGERQPLVSTLLMMAAALDRTPAEILDGVIPPHHRPGGKTTTRTRTPGDQPDGAMTTAGSSPRP